MSEETTAAADATEEKTRTEPLDWGEMVPFSIASIVEHAIIATGAAQHVLRDEFGAPTDGMAFFFAYRHDICQALVEYTIRHRPGAEVLYNKLRELLGRQNGRSRRYEELLPFQRGDLELAARIIPAVVDALEAMNAVIAEKNPPPAIARAPRAIAVEDTIYETVAGPGERDPVLAAARAKADQATREAAKPKKKAKRLSIADAAEGAADTSTSKTASPSDHA